MDFAAVSPNASNPRFATKRGFKSAWYFIWRNQRHGAKLRKHVGNQRIRKRQEITRTSRWIVTHIWWSNEITQVQPTLRVHLDRTRPSFSQRTNNDAITFASYIQGEIKWFMLLSREAWTGSAQMCPARFRETMYQHTTHVHSPTSSSQINLQRDLRTNSTRHQNFSEASHEAVRGAIKKADVRRWERCCREYQRNYGLQHPGQLLAEITNRKHTPNTLDSDRSKRFKKSRHTAPAKRRNKHTFIFQELKDRKYVFIRRGPQAGSWQSPYEGPYQVIKRENKKFVVEVRGKKETVTVDRVKPAYVIMDDVDTPDYRPPQETARQNPEHRIVRSHPKITVNPRSPAQA